MYYVRLLSQHSEIVCSSFQYINPSTLSVASSPLFTHYSLGTPEVSKSANDGPTLVFGTGNALTQIICHLNHCLKWIAKFIATPLGHLLGSSLSTCLFVPRRGANNELLQFHGCRYCYCHRNRNAEGTSSRSSLILHSFLHSMRHLRRKGWEGKSVFL